MHIDKNNQPLVSIIVITYNSARFVLETLESAKAQTYSNIELIVSDDCSSDETVQICRKWIKENNARFIRTELISVEKNTGIPANCNRGLYAAKGEWVKFIAGDDTLENNCINIFIKKVLQNANIEIVFSEIIINGAKTNDYEDLKTFSTLDSGEQYKILLTRNILPAPSSFIKRETIHQLGGMDERYKIIEDYPFFLKVVKLGVKIFVINEPLVNYRVHSNNISLTKEININYVKDLRLFYKDTYLDELKHQKLFLHYLHYSVEYFLLLLASKKIITNNERFKTILTWSSPLHWTYRIRKKIHQPLFKPI